MSATERPPRVALLVATGFGLGYLPKAPGTWGSLGGVALAWGLGRVAGAPAEFAALAAIAAAGVWAAGRTAAHLGKKDPQVVVIDEISGQMVTFASLGAPNWKYLLPGFILFRLLDIWKPFPARGAESWPGGWGIMADDWVAGIYAAALLWAARAAGF